MFPRLSILGERPMWKPYCFVWFDRGSRASKCLLWSQLQRPAWVPGSLNTTGNILETVWNWKYDFGNFGKHNLSQWTEEVDSTPKLIYKHNLILSRTWPSYNRPYIPVYLDCIEIKSTDYLEKSRYFPLSWKISAIWAEILICQHWPEEYHLFLFIFWLLWVLVCSLLDIDLLCGTWDLWHVGSNS